MGKQGRYFNIHYWSSRVPESHRQVNQHALSDTTRPKREGIFLGCQLVCQKVGFDLLPFVFVCDSLLVSWKAPVSCWMPILSFFLWELIVRRLLILGQIRRIGCLLATPTRRCWCSLWFSNSSIAISGACFHQHPRIYTGGTFFCGQMTNVSAFAACSVFGEDALVNVSVEKKDDNDGKLAGYIRIRSKTQGIALSLGDRITSVQRGLPEAK